MPVKLGQIRYISNVFGHVLQMFFCCFLFLYIYLMHWSDSRRHLMFVQILNMSWMPESFFFVCLFVFSHMYLYTSTQRFLLIPAALFLEESLDFTNILCICIQLFKSSCSHQIKTLIARHPFKNPLKALVTFHFVFCVFFIHLIQKNQQNINSCKSIKSVFQTPGGWRLK